LYYSKAENKFALECCFWIPNANISSCSLSIIETFIYGLSSGFWYFPCISFQLLKQKTCFTTEISVWNHFGIISLLYWCTLPNALFLLARILYLATSCKDCGKVYIGETGRLVHTRLKEADIIHERIKKSALA